MQTEKWASISMPVKWEYWTSWWSLSFLYFWLFHATYWYQVRLNSKWKMDDIAPLSMTYPRLLWLEPNGFNLFGKDMACWSKGLMFSSWDLFKKLKKWQTEMSKSASQVQRCWRWTIPQVSVKLRWESQWEKNQSIGGDLQFPSDSCFQWELWPLQSQPSGGL